MVKKNYKGNLEAYKKHSAIPSFYEENTQQAFNLQKETEKELAGIIALNEETQLAYLKITKSEDGQFKIGEADPFVTNFFILD